MKIDPRASVGTLSPESPQKLGHGLSLLSRNQVSQNNQGCSSSLYDLIILLHIFVMSKIVNAAYFANFWFISLYHYFNLKSFACWTHDYLMTLK